MARILNFFITLLASNFTTYTAIASSANFTNLDQCPTWYQGKNSVCECGSTLNGLVRCNTDKYTIDLLACYCMTESKLLNTTIVGNCLYTCSRKYWTTLPNDTSELDNMICKPLKRTGQLCGDCIPDHAPPIYSYTMECVKCTRYETNWLKYIAVAFTPLTIFFFVIVIFRISASTPKLRSFILICQISAMPSQLRYINSLHLTKYSTYVNIAVSLISIWNLDFFRSLYHPFCLHPKVGPLEVLALDYLTAIYPLLLILATYYCIKLHDSYLVPRRALRPFYKCCVYFRKQWEIRRSLADAFATFLLLSYVKVLNISFDLLIAPKIYDINGHIHTSFLYYSGSIRIFSREHIPFAILALFMLTVFNIIPLILLCCYPCQCFQKLINMCKCHCPTLHIFMDIFHGCYRSKPVDYRYFSAFFLFLRIVNLLVFLCTLSRFYYPFSAISTLLAAVIVIIAQPYKVSVYNKLEACLLILFACALISATAYALSPSDKFSYTFAIMVNCVLFILLSYVVGLVIYWAIPFRFKDVIKTKFSQLLELRKDTISTDDFLETVNTDRVFHPNASTSLLSYGST